MSKVLTIRTDDALREALEKRAEVHGKTISELARELLWQALEERPLEQRTAHLRGRLNLSSGTAMQPWRKQLKASNWRG
jgi:plasmid stability protein